MPLPATVDFHGTPLAVALIGGIPHVALKPICDALTVDWSAQFRRLRRHPVLREGIAVMATPSAGGEQTMLFLPLDKLNGWLFGISATRVRDPARRARLIEYQRQCFDVLAANFGIGSAGSPRQNLASSYQNHSALPVTRLLCTAGVSPFDLPPTAQTALAQHAWRLSAEAHAAIFECLARHLCANARPRDMRDPATAAREVERVLGSLTLDQALTQRMWEAVRAAQTHLSHALATIREANDRLARDVAAAGRTTTVEATQ